MITLTILILTIIGLIITTIVMVALGVAAAFIGLIDVAVCIGIIYLIVKFFKSR